MSANRFATKDKPSRPKSFSWSYSKLKNFETCPRRHWHNDVAKDMAEVESPELVWGNYVHDGLAKALTGEPLPEDLWAYQHWIPRIACREGERLYVEQSLAINEDKSVGQFRGAAWFRGKVDVLKVRDTPHGGIGLLMDWKTGKVSDDSVQLALHASLVFASFPSLLKVRTEFVWLKDNSTTREDWARADMDDLWVSLAPRIQALREATEQQNYPPLPGKLCKKYCTVSYCEYHGK